MLVFDLFPSMYIEPCFPLVNFIGLDMALAFHGPHSRNDHSSTWYIQLWNQPPVCSCFMIAYFLLHCLKKLCAVRCSQHLMIVHSVWVRSCNKGNWILQLLLYFIVLDLPYTVPCLTNECNIMVKPFQWSDDPSSGSCDAWLSAWFGIGQSTAMI